MFDWNDLRHFLAVAQHGSTIAAGKALGVSQSTVQRRLAALEAELGRPLTTRNASGYLLTAVGKELLPHAEKVQAQIDGFVQHAAQAADDRRGIIRVTCPEPIVPRLMPLIERFQLRYPQFQVAFVTSDRYLDLCKGDADVAFRSGDTDADLVGRKIADSVWAVYASPGYIERYGCPESVAGLARHLLVTLDGTMAQHRVVTWLTQVAPNAQIAGRSNSVLGLLQSVRSGIGIGPLPANIGDAEPGFVRVLGPIPELARIWRILTPPGLRRNPRISAFFDFIAEEHEAVSAILN